jgi:CRP-like cAMP-binding protein
MNDKTKDTNFAKGQILIREGEDSGDLWIIRSGEVEVYRERKEREFVVAKVGAGEMLGTMTATTGLKRQASARAKTDVTATIIPKETVAKLIKTLPKWANGFIKDLVSRVQYADDLYIERSTIFEAHADSPLAMAMKVTQAMAEGAKDVTIEVEGAKYVPLPALIDQLQNQIGDRGFIYDLVTLMIATEIIHEAKVNLDGRHAPLPDLESLARFAGIISQCIELQGPDGDEFIMPLAQGERKMLRSLSNFALQGAKPGQKRTIALDAIEEHFRVDGEHELKTGTLERAEKLGFLKLDKSTTTNAIVLDAHYLDYGLRCIGVIREITIPAGDKGARKKTLLY